MRGGMCTCQPHLKQTFGLTLLLQVNIRVPRRPLVKHDYLALSTASTGAMPVLLCTSYVSLTNVQLVCPQPVKSTLGIMWVPTQMVQGKDGPVRPVLSASGCTIEGFQASD
jgi:hypothetical protein